MKALCFREFGGPSVLHLEEMPDPIPGEGEVVVATEAIGLNFADIYRRRGTYHLAGQPPYIAGYEAAGRIASLGPGPASFKVGDRVGFADVPFANAELVRAPVDRVIPLPDALSAEAASAVLLQGLTAQYLVRDSHRLEPGETALVHAAGGGVGSLLVQLAKHLGARVVGLTSSAAKAERIRALGADEVFITSSDWVASVRPLEVDVVYDSVGTTLLQSLSAVRTGGQVVFYGMAGGEPPLIKPSLLMDGSKSVTGGDLWNVLTSRTQRTRRAAELFEWLRSGVLHHPEITSFALADGAEAHRLMESGQSVGKILLRP